MVFKGEQNVVITRLNDTWQKFVQVKMNAEFFCGIGEDLKKSVIVQLG